MSPGSIVANLPPLAGANSQNAALPNRDRSLAIDGGRDVEAVHPAPPQPAEIVPSGNRLSEGPLEDQGQTRCRHGGIHGRGNIGQRQLIVGFLDFEIEEPVNVLGIHARCGQVRGIVLQENVIVGERAAAEDDLQVAPDGVPGVGRDRARPQGSFLGGPIDDRRRRIDRGQVKGACRAVGLGPRHIAGPGFDLFAGLEDAGQQGIAGGERLIRILARHDAGGRDLRDRGNGVQPTPSFLL